MSDSSSGATGPRVPEPGPSFDEVYSLRTQQLFEELAVVQGQLLLFDPAHAPRDGQCPPSTEVVDLIDGWYRIIRALRQRRTLLQQSIEWTMSQISAPATPGPLLV